MVEIKAIENSIEAILFASGEPVSLQRLSSVMNLGLQETKSLVKNIQDRYKDTGLQLVGMGEYYEFTTKKEYSSYIKKALEIKKDSPLSQAALEVLAIVAYNGAVSRSFIEQVRGVDSSSAVSTLVHRGLIEEVGRLDLPGKPIAYSVTPVFLRSFSLESLSDLPSLNKSDISDEQTVI